MNRDHNVDERNLKAQLAKWQTTRKVAAWMMAAILLFITAQLAMIVLGNEEIGDLISPLISLVLFGGLLLLAGSKARAIAAEISS